MPSAPVGPQDGGVPHPEQDRNNGILRSLLSAFALDGPSREQRRLSRHLHKKDLHGLVNKNNHSSKTNSNNRSNSNNKKKKRRDCLGRGTCDATVDDENESTTDHGYGSDIFDQLSSQSQQQQQQQQDAEQDLLLCLKNPSFVDIFYDSKDRHLIEATMDEDLIPIGLEPDDSVVLESFELLFRPDYQQHQQQRTLQHYQVVPLECACIANNATNAEDGSLSASCSSLSVSERPVKAALQQQQQQQGAKPSPTNTTTPTPILTLEEEKKKEPEKDELPVRFLRAAKGDKVEGLRRYQQTLQWRKDNKIDSLLFDAWPTFELTKQHYPHYFHGLGRNGQPVFYEQPPKTDLRALRNGGVGSAQLLKHYAMVTEFQWQMVQPDDLQRSIYIIDLAGIRMTDFVGECVDFVRQASAFTAAHYPERAGHVFVVNVPGWFKIIWNVVKPMVDEVTLEKIHILRGKEEIFEALQQQIAVENIPQEYGGSSCYKLGEAPEEVLLRDLMHHNNEMALGKECCYAAKTTTTTTGESCRFCNFDLARNY